MTEPTPLQLKEFRKSVGQLYLDGFIASSKMHRHQLQVVMDCMQHVIDDTKEDEAVKRALKHDLIMFKRLHEESLNLDKTITATYEMAQMEGKHHA